MEWNKGWAEWRNVHQAGIRKLHFKGLLTQAKQVFSVIGDIKNKMQSFFDNEFLSAGSERRIVIYRSAEFCAWPPIGEVYIPPGSKAYRTN